MTHYPSDIAALSVRRPYLATVINLLIVIAGVSALFGVEVRELPDIDRPIVTVRANFPGGAPETIDAEITKVIEGAVARVNGVKAVRSSSEENNLRIRAEFSPTIDLVDAANDVREAVSRVERQLPDGVEDVFVIKADADARAIIQLSVFSEVLTIEQVTARVEDELIPELMSVNGIADVQVFGDRERVLRVVVDPMRLASYGLSVADIAQVLRNAKYDVPAGSFKSQQQEVLVRANATVTKPEDIENLIVRDPLRVGDVATAYYGPADPENFVRLNGRSVVNLGIIRQAKSNTVSISSGVDRVIDRLNTRLGDLTIEKTSDEARFIEGAIYEVLRSLGLAVLIVIAVIALFMGQIRSALIPAIAIPIALIGTVAAIWLMGFSINLITLLALVLATGLVVDDAIVVLENIQRRRAEGLAPRAAAIVGTRQVFFAVIATSLTLVSVFLPISFLPSTAGRLFTEFGFTLAIAVTISSFVALSICPMLAARLPDRQDKGASAGSTGLSARVYAGLVASLLRAPWIIVGSGGIVIVLATIAYQTLGEELVPQEDRGKIVVRLTGPDGVGLDFTDRQVERVEQILQPLVDDGVAMDIFSITGRWDLNRGWIEAPLADWSERTRSEADIAAALRRQFASIPGAQVRVSRSNSLGLRNADGGLTIALTGADYGDIHRATTDFVDAIERDIPQLNNLRVEFRATQPQIAINIDRRAASDLGVRIEDLAATIRVLVDNDEVADLTVDDQTIPVILQATQGAVDDPSDLRNLYVGAEGGRLVALTQLVSFKETAVAAELDRHGQRRAIEIRADPQDGMTLRDAVDAVRVLADKELPASIGLMFLGEAAELNETSQGVVVTFLVAILIVFLVLVAQFESLTSALVVLLTVPFGLCAAIFSLALTGTTINIYSQIGVLMLIGIMAKNAILMVEFADQLREQGRDAFDAALEASVVRVRPILMTMLSTVLAGLPLILATGPGSESRAAIGWVVFGGLSLAAGFTLFLTPVLYLLVAGRVQSRNADADLLAAELAAIEGWPPSNDRQTLLPTPVKRLPKLHTDPTTRTID